MSLNGLQTGSQAMLACSGIKLVPNPASLIDRIGLKLNPSETGLPPPSSPPQLFLCWISSSSGKYTGKHCPCIGLFGLANHHRPNIILFQGWTTSKTLHIISCSGIFFFHEWKNHSLNTHSSKNKRRYVSGTRIHSFTHILTHY